jgi:hypothetical protein
MAARRRRPVLEFIADMSTTGWAVVVVAAAGLLWYVAGSPLPFTGDDPRSSALAAYIDAARRRDCDAVIASMSRRSRELAVAAIGSRSPVAQGFCGFSPAPADLSDFETDRIRVEDASGSTARVSATYTYERLFGFFGRGRDRYTYALVLEDGQWRVDLTEHLDRASRPNLDRRAMFHVQQAFVAINNHRRRTGEVTDDADQIRAELPGYEFPDIRSGIASAPSPGDTIFVTRGPSVACVSLRSETGTLVMVKIPRAQGGSTYAYGDRIPGTCDDSSLPRPYRGSTSGIDDRASEVRR